MSSIFQPEKPLGQQLKDFLYYLDEKRSTRAELKRCHNVLDVMMTPVYHQFMDKIRGHFANESINSERWEVRMAMILGLMAHLKIKNPHVLSQIEDKKKSYAGYFVLPMASPNGGRPRVSELRFRRLLQRNEEELFQALIRVMKLMDGEANLYGLAESVYYWEQGDRIKKDWAFAYFPKVFEK